MLLWLILCFPISGLTAEKKAATTAPSANTEIKDQTTAHVPSTGTPDAPATPKEQAQSKIENSMDNIEIIQQTLESLRTEIDNSKEDATLNRSSMDTIKNGLEQIDIKLKEAYSGLDTSRNNITTNTTDIEKLKTDLLALSRDVRTNASDIYSQKSLIEGNATRLYEILITIADLTKQLEALQGSETKVADKKQEEQTTLMQSLNRLWTLLAIVLVFLTPLAYVLTSSREHYKPLPDGTPQHQGVLLVCLGAFLGYFLIGFGLMFGTSANGWIGTSSYLLSSDVADPNQAPLFPFAEFVLYQAGFTMLAALIIYTAIGRQLSAAAHLLLALFVGIILEPIFGHWAWAGQFIPGNKGWLETSGFIDAAGSTTIHSVAAWFAFVLVWKLGRQHTEQTNSTKANDDAAYSSSAVLFLWLSWLGLTTGTLPISGNQIGSTMLNVILAAASAGLIAFLHYSFFHTGKGMIARALGGFVTGLVAIAASAHSLSFLEALIVGISAGLLHNLAFSLLRQQFLTQAWQARAAYLVTIHGVGGIWGSLCVALLGSEGTFATPNVAQLLYQLQGIAVGLVYSVVLAQVAWILLAFRKRTPIVTN
jgi:Amt family ammonium transporter